MKAHLIALFFLLATTTPPRVNAQTSTQPFTNSTDETARIERLVQLGHLWGQVAFYHPYLAYKDIDWNQALIDHLPSIEKANGREELAKALQDLLDVLEDPVTRVVQEEIHEEQSYPDLIGDLQPSGYLTEDSLLIVKMTDYTDMDLTEWGAAPERLGEVLGKIDGARGILFDLRNLRSSGDKLYDWVYGEHTFLESGGAALLIDRPMIGPATRSRIHYGYELDDDSGGEVYYSGFKNRDGTFYPSAAQRTIPATFLVNEKSYIPDVAFVLQQNGEAAIISEGSIKNRSWIHTNSIKFREGVEVALRINERIYPNGTTGFDPDLVLVPEVDKEQSLKKAIEFARGFKRSQKQASNVIPLVTPLMIREMPGDSTFPSRAHRILAVYKIWNVIEQFFAYKHLMEEPWESVLAEFIPQFEAASDSLEYVLTAAHMLTRLQDGHAGVSGAALSEYYGVATAPVFIRFIEDTPLVTGYRNDSTATASGIRVGDEIVLVDGKPIEARIDEIAPYRAASNPWTHKRYIALILLSGPEGVACNVTVRGVDGIERKLTLPRRRSFWGASSRKDKVVRILENNIGYVDLDRLDMDVDSVFSQLKETRGIIFDMRGYPSFITGLFGPRLGLRDSDMPFAAGRIPVGEPSWAWIKGQTYREERDYFSEAEVPWVYDRPTVLLVDERTQSQAEYVGLEFAATKKTVFIGSETAGAIGNVTSATLPGRLTFRFSGSEIYYPDGKQLQRKGIQPDIKVVPSIEGIRDGKDEVLEAAVKYLRENTSDD